MTILTHSPRDFGSEPKKSNVSDDVASAIERLLIGSSHPMQQLRALVLRASKSRLPVLIQGPTGSGKELVARALHIASGRRGELIAFNVCAVAESVFEDTLFGHVKGAFTGALRDSAGYLAEANGGTLFLDEINGLAVAAQSKLLRAIETGVFRPVGAQRDRTSDFRLIAATNGDLTSAVSGGAFRRDLLYRLSGLTLPVPPLASRLEDIPELMRHFLESDSMLTPLRLEAGALERLRQHDWPGNVRELKHVIARLTVVCETGIASAVDVTAAIGGAGAVGERVTGHRFERERLVDLLERNAWDTLRVAEEAGVNRATIYRRMCRLGITPPRFQMPNGSGKATMAEVGDAVGPEACA